VAPPDADEATEAKDRSRQTRGEGKLAALGTHFKELDAKFGQLTADNPECEAAVIAREKIMKALWDNRDAQEPFSKKVKVVGDHVQLYQEMGGLVGNRAGAAHHRRVSDAPAPAACCRSLA